MPPVLAAVSLFAGDTHISQRYNILTFTTRAAATIIPARCSKSAYTVGSVWALEIS